MSGFQGGESAATVERERGYMKEAQLRWPFLTSHDASTVRNALRLVGIAGDRTGRKPPEAGSEAEARPAGRDFGR